jgi:xanthine dehydrogenase YagR molybdenum-binding subunit
MAPHFKIRAGPEAAPKELDVTPAEGDLRPWDLDTHFEVIGTRQPRLDGPAKVTGRAKYTADIQMPGMLWARMIRAPIPAGQIVAIDTSRAQALPEVRAIWKTELQTVRFAGQDIAAVAATSPEMAEEAVRLIAIRYESRPFVVDLEPAIKGGPQVYGNADVPAPKDAPRRGNVVGPQPPRRNGPRGNAEKALGIAEVTLEGTYRLPVHTHSALETHGVLAHWEGDQLTVYASTQGISTVRDGMAEALGIDRKNIRVITEHMGGGFGAKLSPSASGSAFAVVACKLARDAKAPVKLLLDRREEHLCTGNAPSALMTVRLGAQRDGVLTAIHHRSYGSAGIAGGAGTGGPALGLYQSCPNVAVEEYDVFTNAGPAAPLRAPGHPQGAFALESAIDELADKLGMDPLEFRLKNEAHPVRRLQIPIGAQAIGWDRRNAFRKQTGTLRTGLGMANGLWYVVARNGGVGAEVRVHRDGGVELFQGAQDIGSGLRTALAMVVAEELGLSPGQVAVHLGDTRFPEGPGSGGSNTTNSVAPAVRLAAHGVGQKLLALAGAKLGVAPQALALAKGRIFVRANPSEGLTFQEVASGMPGEQLTHTAEKLPQFETYQSQIAGVQFAEVSVDLETGVVRVVKMVSVNDCGFPMNLLTSESQAIGAMIQGASWALLENRILDSNFGTMVNPNLESYKILGPADMFEARSILTPVANGGNNTSAAGLGEPPIVPTLAAIGNAIAHATGARLRELPFTPDRVLAALAGKGRT